MTEEFTQHCKEIEEEYDRRLRSEYPDDDDDPWGANSEMDYISNNGGDWIDY